MCTLDDFHQALTATKEQLDLGGNHLRYLVLLLYSYGTSDCEYVAGYVIDHGLY